jgi:trimeric autotransporter adhesin
MDVLKWRSVLLASVSVVTVGLAAPAAAATTPGVEHNVVGPNADDLLTISLPGEPQAVHGDVEHGTATATAILNFGGGQIVQIGFGSGTGTGLGNADLTIANGGSGLMIASAIASNPAGPAKASALALQDIMQIADAIANATGLIENSGSLQVKAAAAAHGSAAQANVLFNSAIAQEAIGNRADAGIFNSGSLQIIGSAVATATMGAAIASLGMSGIHQAATGQSAAAAHFTNTGQLAVTGIAQASGATAATAAAAVSEAVLQSASATGPSSSVTLDNEGLIAIHAIANARADDVAVAGAAVGAGLVQVVQSPEGGDLLLENGATYDVSAAASANAGLGGFAQATAVADWFFQGVFAQSHSASLASSSAAIFLHESDIPRGPASIALSNSGTMSLIADAHVAGRTGFALAAVTGGTQSALGSDASVSIVNSGKMEALAIAQATASRLAGAIAFASGLHQLASAHSTHFTASSVSGAGHVLSVSKGFGPASASLVNSGTIDLVAQAHGLATGTGTASGLIAAAATAEVPVAILQAAVGTSAHVSLGNSGTIRAAATATATATGPQNLAAQVDEHGIDQAALASGITRSATFGPSTFVTGNNLFFQGPASVELTNSGTIDVSGLINASAGGFARIGSLGFGIQQIARGTSAAASIVNDGSITVAGSGHVHGASETGFFFDSGIQQHAAASGAAVASIRNSGQIEVLSRDIGSASVGVATNVAIANGINQSATVATPLGATASAFGTATASFENSGSLSVVAQAKADGGTLALGVAFAAGIRQAPIFGTLNARLDNSGDISALADASAEAAVGPAFGTAHATGYLAEAGNVVADVVNSGTIDAAASVHVAGSGGSAFAFAVGVSVNALSLGVPGIFGNLSGAITNSGMIQVEAKVDSASSGTVGAVATGVFLSAPAGIDATITNTGTIDVTAITGHQDNAQAWGIHVFDFAPGFPGPGDVLTVDNSGRIIARQSSDGGATFKHGLAIDVTGAPNPTVINLLGGGLIYGDIAVQAGDVINVKAGPTLFDGVINPSFLPAGGVTAADLDSGLMGVGTLNIEDSGNLILADPRFTGNPSMFDGPAFAFVDTLNVASDGTLTLQLQPEAGGLQPVGTYPQIFANTANLGGTLVADVMPANGLFADSYDWQNVIDANVRNGTFDQCVLGGPFTNSLLLKLSCSYDSNANVDLALTRVPFNSVAGLNANGTAVGSGLDSFFNVNLTGGPAHLFGDLFLFTDQSNFNIALNQLSGSAFANYLNSFPSLGVHENDLVDRASNCEVPALAGSVLECRASSPIHVWGQLDYQHRSADGDVEAGKSVSTRFTGLLGIDASVGNSAIVGVDAGWLNNNFRDDQFDDEVKGNGWTIGAYAAYDPGAFFVKGVTTYSSLNGSSTRHIDFAGLATGATFAANPHGSPDVKMWTAGLHGGARLPMGRSSVITPYLNLDYVNAKLDSFEENNGGGAELTVSSSKSNHTFVTGGVKWAGRLGGVVPEINLGYRYRFGASHSTIGAFFTPDPENNFDIASATQKRGEFLAGLSVGGKLGSVDVRLGYEAEFNGDVMSHSGNFKFVLPLGGHAAPPPPAPPPPAPPPRSPATQTCSDGSVISAIATCPPPPPPPPPSPPPAERGK